jgi:hypothetical protein
MCPFVLRSQEGNIYLGNGDDSHVVSGMLCALGIGGREGVAESLFAAVGMAVDNQDVHGVSPCLSSSVEGRRSREKCDAILFAQGTYRELRRYET